MNIEDNSNFHILRIHQYYNPIVKRSINNLYDTCKDLIENYNCRIYNPCVKDDGYYFGYVEHKTAGSIILAEFQDISSKLEFTIKHPNSFVEIQGVKMKRMWRRPKNLFKKLGGTFEGRYWSFKDINNLKQILKDHAANIRFIC